MSRIRFIEARFPNPDESRFSIEERLRGFLRKLRNQNSRTEDRLVGPEPEVLTLRRAGGMPKEFLTDDDLKRVARRAASLAARKEASSGLAHLRREDREQLRPLSNGAQLIEIRSDDHADELAAQLHAELPWMAPATTEVWQAMRRSVRDGQPGLRLPPLLLDGPPGIGKSHWARRLGQLLGMPVTVVEATGEQASFGVVGSQRGWSGACPGRLIQTVLQSVIANPVIVVDEVEKAGFSSDLGALIDRRQPDAWLFGHTHRWLEAYVDKTLIRNVSLGYPREVYPINARSLLLRGLIEDGWLHQMN